jgi:hypothetical protein
MTASEIFQTYGRSLGLTYMLIYMRMKALKPSQDPTILLRPIQMNPVKRLAWAKHHAAIEARKRRQFVNHGQPMDADGYLIEEQGRHEANSGALGNVMPGDPVGYIRPKHWSELSENDDVTAKLRDW